MRVQAFVHLLCTLCVNVHGYKNVCLCVSMRVFVNVCECVFVNTYELCAFVSVYTCMVVHTCDCVCQDCSTDCNGDLQPSGILRRALSFL